METNLSIIPQTGMGVMRRNILDQEIEDAVIVEPNVMVEEDHPHFIESNTNEITLEELKNKCIIRKSKFPQNPKRSVRFSGKRTKRSVQKRKARNTQKAETKVL